MTDIPRLRRPFRVGVARGPNGAFKSIATVGVSSDGGLFVAPTSVRDFGWRFGTLSTDLAAPSTDHVDTHVRPKLHYHRSGIASITLTGTALEYRSLKFTPIPLSTRAQLVSIVATRTWEFATSPTQRKGDVVSLESRWPYAVAFTFSVIQLPPSTPPLRYSDPILGPVALLPGAPGRFAVDVAAYGTRAVLLGRVLVKHEWDGGLEPGTSVVALPWTTGGRSALRLAIGLWSSSVRNPLIQFDTDDELLNGDDVVRAQRGSVSIQTYADHLAQRAAAKPRY